MAIINTNAEIKSLRTTSGKGYHVSGEYYSNKLHELGMIELVKEIKYSSGCKLFIVVTLDDLITTIPEKNVESWTTSK